jgi:hypothetical protein
MNYETKVILQQSVDHEAVGVGIVDGVGNAGRIDPGDDVETSVSLFRCEADDFVGRVRVFDGDEVNQGDVSRGDGVLAAFEKMGDFVVGWGDADLVERGGDDLRRNTAAWREQCSGEKQGVDGVVSHAACKRWKPVRGKHTPGLKPFGLFCDERREPKGSGLPGSERRFTVRVFFPSGMVEAL